MDWKQIIDISPVINESTAVFPGDVPFQRKILMDMQNNDHLTLSSIESTVHIGAHTDAPNHYAKDGAGIHDVSLEPYFGTCQVIEVTGKNGLITVDELPKIEAPRVLFKTLSFPNPEKWNDDFVAIAPETVEYLHEQEVKLVGIDTPSVDPATAKTLSSHHKIASFKMAILEGVVLNEVEPGLYNLVALPLKLFNCDASPVRAVLLPRS